MIKRYEIACDGMGDATKFESDVGEYVLVEDYLALESKLEEVSKAAELISSTDSELRRTIAEQASRLGRALDLAAELRRYFDTLKLNAMVTLNENTDLYLLLEEVEKFRDGKSPAETQVRTNEESTAAMTGALAGDPRKPEPKWTDPDGPDLESMESE